MSSTLPSIRVTSQTVVGFHFSDLAFDYRNILVDDKYERKIFREKIRLFLREHRSILKAMEKFDVKGVGRRRENRWNKIRKRKWKERCRCYRLTFLGGGCMLDERPALQPHRWQPVLHRPPGRGALLFSYASPDTILHALPPSLLTCSYATDLLSPTELAYLLIIYAPAFSPSTPSTSLILFFPTFPGVFHLSPYLQFSSFFLCKFHPF